MENPTMLDLDLTVVTSSDPSAVLGGSGDCTDTCATQPNCGGGGDDPDK